MIMLELGRSFPVPLRVFESPLSFFQGPGILSINRGDTKLLPWFRSTKAEPEFGF